MSNMGVDGKPPAAAAVLNPFMPWGIYSCVFAAKEIYHTEHRDSHGRFNK